VKFEMQSADVIHSLWIPQMGQKQDVVPGITTKIVITPTRTGTFTLICTELCGLGHATMRAPVRVLDQPAFQAWLAKQRSAGGAGGATSGAAGGRTGGATSDTSALGKTTFASAGAAAATRSRRPAPTRRSVPTSTTSPPTRRPRASRSPTTSASRSSTRTP
jgi:cytochrome c oxidase subunit 2